MSADLEGRVAIVTGGARGQGAATARLFVENGARVVIADVRDEEGHALASELGDAAQFVHLDVTDESNWQNLVTATTERWGHIDILVNNAAILLVSALNDVKKAEFSRLLEVNVLGAWLGMKTVSPVMIDRKRGSIINVCSTAALWGMHGTGAYLTSKWALRGMSKTAAMELGWQGVRVNAIFPGGVNTPFANPDGAGEDDMNQYFKGQPIQRIGRPDEIAQTTLFLASDKASYVCGAEIAVDGGMTLGVYGDLYPGGPNSPQTAG
ncbi:glucose 1-dehydrogenase (plasmid) [Sphingobium sp. SJ10-10]|uniref:SDR family NAD(P)-dependent oxidoreductase n=1 Tax=Sphingobium sp. SJ10-10 TaxID=3114999 RepID=UPI002E1961D1|nr:glucose 1-dehydrogenase [Sphingobium sp. SJ10-10]